MAVTLGPIIGHTADTTAKVWLRGEPGKRHGEKEYCYGALDLLANRQVVRSQYCHLKDYYDFTGVVEFTGLDANTHYTVRCDTIYHKDETAPDVDTPVSDPIVSGEGSATGEFTTAPPEDATTLRFVFGSCRYLYWDNFIHSDADKGDKAFRSIFQLHQDKPLDFTLMVGDQIYADALNLLQRARRLEEYYEIYRRVYAQPHFRNLLRRVPNYMILDDHEIEDNWSKDKIDKGFGGVFEAAMTAYYSYQHIQNPPTPKGQLWYAFRRGQFPFFVMDVRTQRIRKPQGAQPKTILGREQMNTLLAWLYDNRAAPRKFLVTSVPFFPDTKKGTDKWAEFEHERSLLLEFLRVERIRNVVFLSGDVHNTSFATMRCFQDRGLRITSLVASPFYWPYPHDTKSDFYQSRSTEYMQWTDRARRMLDRIEYRYDGTGFISDESFILVDVDLDRGRAEIGMARAYNRKGRPHPDYPDVYTF